MATTETVVGVVEGKSAFGIKVNGKWYNPNKFASPKPDFSAVGKGDTVTMLVSGDKYITSMSVGGGVPTSATTAVRSVTSSSTTLAVPYKNTTREEIARGTAVKAVLGSTILHSVYEAETDKNKVAVAVRDLINQTTNYILTGTWVMEVTAAEAEAIKKEEVPF